MSCFNKENNGDGFVDFVIVEYIVFRNRKFGYW